MAFETTRQEILKQAIELKKLYDSTRIQKYKDEELRLRKIVAELSTLILGASDLNSLSDVTISSPSNNQVLAYNSTLGVWVNQTPAVVSTPTLAQVTTAGNTTTNAITVGTVNVTYNNNTYLPGISITNTNSGTSSLSGVSFTVNGVMGGFMAYIPSNYILAAQASTMQFTSAGNNKLGFIANSNQVGVAQDIYFSTFGSNATYQMQIKGNTGNVQIGTNTDAGYKLDVAGTARIVQSTAGTKFTVTGIDQEDVLLVNWGGTNSIGLGSNTANNPVLRLGLIRFTAHPNGGRLQLSGATGRFGTDTELKLYGSISGTATGTMVWLGSNSDFSAAAHNPTSGTLNVVGVLQKAGPLYAAFNPTSGNATFNIFNIDPVINTSGTYAGIVRGIYYNPTLTSITGVTHRAIETVAGDVLLATTSGDVAIGTATLATATKLTLGGSETAISAIARGQLINTTLVAAANNDVLVGLDINPTFTNGAFTGTENIHIRSISAVNATVVRNILLRNTGVGGGSGVSIGFNNLAGNNLSHAFIKSYYANGMAISLGTGGGATLISEGTVALVLNSDQTANFTGKVTANSGGFQATGISANMLMSDGGTPVITRNGSTGIQFLKDAYWQTFSVFTNNVENLRITGTGNTLIGTTTDAGYKLDVNGTTRVNNIFYVTNSSFLGNLRIEAFANNQQRIIGAYGENITWGAGGNTMNLNATEVYVSNSFLGGSFWIQSNAAFCLGQQAPADASSLFDIRSTSRGFLQPRMTNAQVVAIATPATGLQAYDTTNNKNRLYNGTAWQNIATETWVAAQGYGAQFKIDYDPNITGTRNGVNLLFTTSSTFIATTTRVFLNGQRLTRGATYDYVETGTNQITFAVAPVSTDQLIIEYQI